MWYKVLLKDGQGKFITTNTFITDELLLVADDVDRILKSRFGKYYNWYGAKTEAELDSYSADELSKYFNKQLHTDDDPVKYCENFYPEMCQSFKNFQQKQYEMLCKKQMDYGPLNISMGTHLKNQNEIIAALTGVIVRANDKMQRLLNLIVINRQEPKNESVVDTFMDLAVYATIALCIKDGKWGK